MFVFLGMRKYSILRLVCSFKKQPVSHGDTELTEKFNWLFSVLSVTLCDIISDKTKSIINQMCDNISVTSFAIKIS